MYYTLVMKNIANWPYREIVLWLYYVLLHDVRYPKTHLLEVVDVFTLGKWTIDTQGTPYPMI